MRAQLQAAASQQNLELNSFSGTIAQAQLDELKNSDISFNGTMTADPRQKIVSTGVLAGGPLDRRGPLVASERPTIAGIAAPQLALDYNASREINQQQGLAATLVQASARCKS